MDESVATEDRLGNNRAGSGLAVAVEVTNSQLCTDVNLATQAGQMSGDAADLVLIEIPLSDNDGTVFTSNYPQTGAAGDVVALPFSQLGGTYVLPNANDGTGVKLTLGLYDASDVMIQELPLNGGASIVLERNVLYSLGTKNLSTSTEGYGDTADDTPNDGTDPKDDDDALDLMNDQIVLVEVESGWGNISDLLLN